MYLRVYYIIIPEANIEGSGTFFTLKFEKYLMSNYY